MPRTEPDVMTMVRTLVKVVDPWWYERNKHVLPASVWGKLDATKEYNKGHPRDMRAMRPSSHTIHVQSTSRVQ